MSWEIMSTRVLHADCACGKGYVERVECSEMDDWNRVRDGVLSCKLCCDVCSQTYHLESGYLVPNGLTLDVPVDYPYPHSSFNEFDIVYAIVNRFSVDTLRACVDEFARVHFSTRVESDAGKCVVRLYFNRYNRRGLKIISSFLSGIIDNYDELSSCVVWLNSEKSKYDAAVRFRDAVVNDVKSQSFCLHFEYVACGL